MEESRSVQIFTDPGGPKLTAPLDPDTKNWLKQLALRHWIYNIFTLITRDIWRLSPKTSRQSQVAKRLKFELVWKKALPDKKKASLYKHKLYILQYQSGVKARWG